MKAHFIAAICGLCQLHAAAPEPARIFGDHMVLQRGISTPVWGMAAPGEDVAVSFAGQTATTTANSEGTWMLRLAPLECPSGNAAHSLVIRGSGGTTTLHDILIGDVWICGGQSNMAFKLNRATGGAAAASAANDPLVRICDVAGERSSPDQPAPSDLASAEWKIATPASTADFSAVGWFYGEALRQSIGVPVGLIDTSVGGTPMRSWISRETMAADEILRPQVEQYDQEVRDLPKLTERYRKLLALYEQDTTGKRQKPYPPKSKNSSYRLSYLHASVIRPLQPLAIKGVIWYQGEADAGRHAIFQHQFSTLVSEWRNEWAQGDFPWLFAQLAPCSETTGRHFPRVWEAQSKAQAIPNSAMIVTLDVGVSSNIHPPDKKPVGERLALAARSIVYHQDVRWRSPAFKSMEKRGNEIVLHFENPGGDLVPNNSELRHFTVAGADRKFLPASARVIGDHSVAVSHPGLTDIAAVRYGWYQAGGEVGASLFTKDGLPVAPFRTDDWPE